MPCVFRGVPMLDLGLRARRKRAFALFQKRCVASERSTRAPASRMATFTPACANFVANSGDARPDNDRVSFDVGHGDVSGLRRIVEFLPLWPIIIHGSQIAGACF